MYYTLKVRIAARKTGPVLRVWGLSKINRNTYLGNNVNFNGMEISGQGKVVIGDNFHSGKECLMITQIHDYDRGDFRPVPAWSAISPNTR